MSDFTPPGHCDQLRSRAKPPVSTRQAVFYLVTELGQSDRKRAFWAPNDRIKWFGRPASLQVCPQQFAGTHWLPDTGSRNDSSKNAACRTNNRDEKSEFAICRSRQKPNCVTALFDRLKLDIGMPIVVLNVISMP